MPGDARHLTAIVQTIGPANCLTTAEIAAAMGIPGKRVATACTRLVVSQIIERVERGCFRLTPAGRDVQSGKRALKGSGPKGQLTGPRVPRPSTLRQRAWTAIRLSRRFTVSEITMLAATPEDRGAERHLVKWFGHLVKAGYLAELPRRAPGTALTSNGHKCWALVRDTGETAPLIRPDGTYYDYNTGEGEPRAKRRAAPCSQ